jgi:hypothetical protein
MSKEELLAVAEAKAKEKQEVAGGGVRWRL